MMENVRKISKRYYVRQIVACWLVYLMAFGLPLRVAMAEVVMTSNPTGTITVTPLGVGTTQDMTATHGAIGNFSDFDIAATHIVDCVQPTDMSQALFRVSGNGTEIYGTFNANGGIWLINPAGIIFGSNASVNVNQLVASSLNISDADFTNGLATGSFQFTGGGIGDVKTFQGSVINAEAIALIGRHVINRGSINGDYVIMAAGDSVLITGDPSSSNVVVEVAMANPAHHVVDHGGDLGTGPGAIVEADYVILAAGDIWSAAIVGVEGLRAEAKRDVVIEGNIIAHSDGSSDAIAGVEILAGGDVTVNAPILADADALGALDNAIANVTIDADGSVFVNAPVTADAEALVDGTGSATAGVDIDAGGNVFVNYNVKADADTENSGNAVATVNIDTPGDVLINNDVTADADIKVGSGAGDAKATVNIGVNTEVTNVTISNAGDIYAYADTNQRPGNAEALIDIDASGIVTAYSARYIQADAGTQTDYTTGGHADATVDIEAGGVIIDDGDIKAYTDTGLNDKDGGNATSLVKIDVGDGDVTLNNDGEIDVYADAYGDGADNATGTVDIDAGNVTLSSGGKIDLDASIYGTTGNAEALVDIDATGDVTVGNAYEEYESYIYAYAYTGDGSLGDADNLTATVDIDATNVTLDYGEIDAYAYTGGPSSGTAGDLTALVDIDATGDVTVGNAQYGTPGWIDAYAYTGSSSTGNAGNLAVTVDIDATNVTVEYGDIDAYAYTGSSSEGTVKDLTAKVDIDAVGGDVTLGNAQYGYEGDIDTKAYTGEDSLGDAGNLAATVEITTTGSDVNVEYGDIEAKAYTGGSSEGTVKDLTAKVDVDADGDVTLGNVTYDDSDEGDIEAKAYTGGSSTGKAGNLDATVDIDATNVTVEYGDIDAYAYTGGSSSGTVKDLTAKVDIDADGGDVTLGNAEYEDSYEGYVKAKAYTGNNSSGKAGNLAGTVDIDATNVTVEYGDIRAEARTGDDSYSNVTVGNLTATTTVNADGDVTLGNAEYDDEGGINAYTGHHAHSGNADNLSATTTVNSGGNVTVEYGDIGTTAHAGTPLTGSGPKVTVGNLTATTTVNADGSVTLGNAKYGQEGYIEANASARGVASTVDADDLSATTTVNSGGNVTVEYGDIETVASTGGSYYSYYYGYGTSSTGTVGDLTATTTVNADGDVTVGNAEYGDEGYIEADAHTGSGSGPYRSLGNAGDLSATTIVNAGGNVTVEYGDIETDAYTGSNSSGNAGDLSATTTVNSGGNVVVALDENESEISAYARPGSNSSGSMGSATATVEITTTGSDVTVGYGSIYAQADVHTNEALLGDPENGPETRDATAEVTILADGQVTVEEYGVIYTDATVHIDYPDVDGDLEDDPVVIPGDATATTTINADTGVTVEGSSQGEPQPGQIYADASIEYYEVDEGEPFEVEDGPDATANVDIQTCGNVIVDGLIRSHAWISDTSGDSYPENLFGDATADVIVKAFGDVIVNQGSANPDYQSHGLIGAEAYEGLTNSAGVTVLAVGDVIVNDGSGGKGHESEYQDSQEEIMAVAGNGPTNNAFLRIATREGYAGNVEVSGQISAYTMGQEGSEQTNTSDVQIYADQDLIVYGGYAEFWDIEGIEFSNTHEGGQITAWAFGSGPYDEFKKDDLVSFNTANVDIYAGRDVIVHGAELIERPIGGGSGGYFDGGQIIAYTGWNDDSRNTSHVGIYAQDDVILHDATIIGQLPDELPPYPIEIDGWVWAGAHGSRSENRADVEICAQDDAVGDGLVEADAGTGANGRLHSAHISIAAGDLITGSGSVIADADPSAEVVEASVTAYVTDLGNILFDFDEGEIYSTTDKGVTETPPKEVVDPLLDCPECDFDDWDWIDWTWCVDCEVVTMGVAPIFQIEAPEILGCPLEMAVAALELGTTPETIQVAIADALALNPTIQPCQACATLIDAAAILRDEDGSRMAAMLSVFNELAPSDAPFTPEMGTSIVTAFAGAAEGSQYASVAEYVDAFVQYVAVVDVDLGAPIDDSLAFVMDKYGTGITGSDNTNIAAFVAARLESGATFGD